MNVCTLTATGSGQPAAVIYAQGVKSRRITGMHFDVVPCR